MTFAHLFSGSVQALKYGQYRPSYPKELYTNIFDFSGEGSRQLAVDIATGTGQAAVELAESYSRVIAQDGSEEQLKNAVKMPNIEYQHADAHQTGLSDHCADLITVAQALHWFRHADFYKEIRRILKPTGTFAAWTYCVPILNHRQHPAQAALQQLCSGTLGPYWAAPRRYVDAGYRGIEPQPDDFLTVVRREMEMSKQQTVDEVIGYLESWSAYQTHLKQHPDLPDPLIAFKQQLLETLGTTDSSTPLTVIMPLTLILAKDPQPLAS